LLEETEYHYWKRSQRKEEGSRRGEEEGAVRYKLGCSRTAEGDLTRGKREEER